MCAKSRYAREVKRLRDEARIEADTIWLLRFLRKGVSHKTPEDQRWFSEIKMHSNPQKNPATLDEAIKQFQIREKVHDWHEIAERYEITPFYFP